MKKLFLFAILFASAIAAQAQTYNPGLPQPGLPRSLGQKTMANSTSVTMASNQTPISVTGNITATNPSVSTNGTAAPTSSTQIGGVDQAGNLTPLVIGAQGITVSASQATSPWVVSVPAGVGITNTPTVNQGTSPWVVFQPTGIGITNTVTVNQGTSPWVTTGSAGGGVAITNTPSVVIPGGVAITNTPTVNQGTSPWVVSSSSVTVTASTITRIANSASSQSLLAANGSRKQVFLFNDAATANCYVKFGVTASATDFTVKLFATDTYIMDPPVYTGAIDYICDAASGSMEVNEQ